VATLLGAATRMNSGWGQSHHMRWLALGNSLSRDGFCLDWQLQDPRSLPPAQGRQEHNLTAWKFQCVVKNCRVLLINLAKNCRPVLDQPSAPKQKTSSHVLDIRGNG